MKDLKSLLIILIVIIKMESFLLYTFTFGTISTLKSHLL